MYTTAQQMIPRIFLFLCRSASPDFAGGKVALIEPGKLFFAVGAWVR